MSKEQTPIEELVIRLADLYTDLGNAKRPDQGMKLVSIITKEIEQYTKANVLEALEREFSNVLVVKDNGMNITGKEYYETEVKPNYEKKNS
jgi:hypothetical protein